MKRLIRIVLITVASMALLLGLVVAPPKAAAVYTPRAGVSFNNILGPRASQETLLTQLNRAIDAAPAGSYIKMAQSLLNLDSTVQKLIRADQRGVIVQVLVDSGGMRSEARRLRTALGTTRGRDESFVATCSRGCMSRVPSTMHAKFYLFSKVGGAKWVSMVSSANPYTQNVYNSWNNSHTIVNNFTIYRSLSYYFSDMLRDRTDYRYNRTVSSGIYTLYMFPRRTSSGNIVNIPLSVLNRVSCSGGTRIRVAQWGWTAARVDTARRLQVLFSRGCKVEVILNRGRTGRAVFSALLKRSSKYGVMPVYDAWYDTNNNDIAGRYMHHKLLTIDGRISGRSQRVVYTGSQNYTTSGSAYNNDLVMRVAGTGTYNAYMRNLDYIRREKTKKISKVPSALRLESNPNERGSVGRTPTEEFAPDFTDEQELETLDR
jgi:phosphatidylserine/phosphatidylglycerophosphate/cardiolipin synthase-like enzyme